MKNCINCKERHIACHDQCEDYKKFKKEREIANEKARQMNNSVGWDGYLKVKERNRR